MGKLLLSNFFQILLFLQGYFNDYFESAAFTGSKSQNAVNKSELVIAESDSAIAESDSAVTNLLSAGKKKG